MLRKTAAASLTLGSGAALGPEAPSVELGANLSVLLGKACGFDNASKQMLMAAGAAAGVASGFLAPVAGALFAVEFVLKNQLGRSNIAAVFISTCAASTVVRELQGLDLGGTRNLISIPSYDFGTPAEVLLFALLGVCCALSSVVLYEGVKVRQLALPRNHPSALLGCPLDAPAAESHPPTHRAVAPRPWDLPGWTSQASDSLLKPLGRWAPATGGLVCGLIALLWYSDVGFGSVSLAGVIQNTQELDAWGHLSAGVAKLVASSVCAGSGLVGGLFAPSLFVGAHIGGAFGQALHEV